MVTRHCQTLAQTKRPRPKPRPFRYTLPLPDPARIRRHHRLAYLAAKRLAELIEILHGALHSPLASAMGISLGLYTSCLFRLVFAPHLSKSDEVPLCRRVAILLA